MIASQRSHGPPVGLSLHLPAFDGTPYLATRIEPEFFHVLLLPSEWPLYSQLNVAFRQAEANRLPKLVAGELDWIAMKALDKDRSRRYETASALAADVQRYLKDEAIEARPPSLTMPIAPLSALPPQISSKAVAFSFEPRPGTPGVWKVRSRTGMPMQRMRGGILGALS